MPRTKNPIADRTDGTTPVRLDKWLWAARFFKTRSLAQAAVEGGRVHYNGSRVKPGRMVQTGAELRVNQGPYERVVVVTGLAARRGPASVAALLYQETPASIAAREAQAAEHRLMAGPNPGPQRRPNKQDRRRIIRFTSTPE
jgi:ribosome-associated heat shock protein Hsp15